MAPQRIGIRIRISFGIDGTRKFIGVFLDSAPPDIFQLLYVGQFFGIDTGAQRAPDKTLDLDYAEDSSAETDMNVVMNNQDGFIEVQGTAEAAPFSDQELNSMLILARAGIKRVFEFQLQA